MRTIIKLDSDTLNSYTAIAFSTLLWSLVYKFAVYKLAGTVFNNSLLRGEE